MYNMDTGPVDLQLPPSPVPLGSPGVLPLARVPHVSHQYTGRKVGDVELERQVNERIRELGLMDNKLLVERELADRLDETLEKGDTIVGALKRCRRRKRLNEQLNAFSGEVRNIIKQDITRDSNGNKVAYVVNVLMGRFTKDVKYLVEDKEVVINGHSPSGPNLTKEIRIEFPENVDITLLNVSYSAGVFKMQVPFRMRLDSLSSGGSERRSSLTSSESWTSESTGIDQE